MAWSATTPLKPKEGLNGAPNPWPCHFSLYLPQASRLLGMTKGRAALSFWSLFVQHAMFIQQAMQREALPSPLSSRAKPRDLQFHSTSNKSQMKAPLLNGITEFSSRPKRSEVEGPAVLPTHYSLTTSWGVGIEAAALSRFTTRSLPNEAITANRLGATP
jgi:hypothetical protein